MSYFGFIRTQKEGHSNSHPTGEVKMFQEILKIQCFRHSQQVQMIYLGLDEPLTEYENTGVFYEGLAAK